MRGRVPEVADQLGSLYHIPSLCRSCLRRVAAVCQDDWPHFGCELEIFWLGSGLLRVVGVCALVEGQGSQGAVYHLPGIQKASDKSRGYPADRLSDALLSTLNPYAGLYIAAKKERIVRQSTGLV